MHPERVDPAHGDLRSLERLFGLLELVRAHALRHLQVEVGVNTSLFDAVYDVAVEVGAYQAHLVAVVRERERERRGHYPRPQNSYRSHRPPFRRRGSIGLDRETPPRPYGLDFRRCG